MAETFINKYRVDIEKLRDLGILGAHEIIR